MGLTNEHTNKMADKQDRSLPQSSAPATVWGNKKIGLILNRASTEHKQSEINYKLPNSKFSKHDNSFVPSKQLALC